MLATSVERHYFFLLVLLENTFRESGVMKRAPRRQVCALEGKWEERV